MKLLRIFALAVAPALISAVAIAAQDPPPAPGKAAIKQLVIEVLDENPELLIDALEKLRDKAQAVQKQDIKKPLGELRRELERDPNTFIAGNPQGDITVVEFFDYRCGYCKKADPIVQQLLKTDGRVRLALKEFPILGPDSLFASRAAIASMSQGKYSALHSALMAAQGALGEERVLRIAADAGVDTAKLRQDMNSPKVEKIIARNREIAGMLGISGTPAFIIGDMLEPGVIDLEQMQWLVDSAREDCQTC